MSERLTVVVNRSFLVVCVIFLTVAVSSREVLAYGGDGGDGGDGGGGGDGISSVAISVWDVPFGLPDAPGVSGGTIELATHHENRMREAWHNRGGQSGTGKTFEQWQQTSQAGRVVDQLKRQDEMQQAHSGSSRANVTVVALEVLDGAGQASQFVLSWVPGVNTGASIGLDVGRAFADRFKEATEQGYSYADAVASGMQSATLKGVTSTISSLTFGRLANHHHNQVKRITGRSYQEVDRLLYHGLGYGATKTAEQLVTYGVDSARNDFVNRAARNSSRSVSPGPSFSVGTYGVSQASR